MLKYVVLISTLCLTKPGLAAVTIQFDPLEHFTDLSLNGSDTPNIQTYLIQQFTQIFNTLAGRYLPKDHTLAITVKNIDMAGGYEPWRAPYLNNTRIMREVYAPRIVLHYRRTDKSGMVLADIEEAISDLNYLTMLDVRQYLPNDPLRYEKAMLERWFVATFTPKP
jgi:hypothetical protein